MDVHDAVDVVLHTRVTVADELGDNSGEDVTVHTVLDEQAVHKT